MCVCLMCLWTSGKEETMTAFFVNFYFVWSTQLSDTRKRTLNSYFILYQVAWDLTWLQLLTELKDCFFSSEATSREVLQRNKECHFTKAPESRNWTQKDLREINSAGVESAAIWNRDG